MILLHPGEGQALQITVRLSALVISGTSQVPFTTFLCVSAMTLLLGHGDVSY